MIKNLIKRSVPISLKARIKVGKYCNNLKNRVKYLKEETGKIVLMVGTPIHTNLGDHLITLAQFNFLQEDCRVEKVVEVPTEMYQIYRKKIINLKCIEIVVINGGGWMGNLWVPEEKLLQQIVDDFSDKKIIIFPQTIYFDPNFYPYEELIESANNIFSKCKDIVLCVRDNNSFVFAKEKYNNINILLVPDIALSYSEYSPKHRGRSDKKVGECLRNDREIDDNTKSAQNEIMKLFRLKGFECESISTMHTRRVKIEERNEIVLERMREFASYDFIITDRLHGMIFAYLTGTPCIALDNKTHKVSGVYNQWLKRSNKIFPVFSKLDMALLHDFIDSNINNETEENVCTGEEFAMLKENIINGENKEIDFGYDSKSKM